VPAGGRRKDLQVLELFAGLHALLPELHDVHPGRQDRVQEHGQVALLLFMFLVGLEFDFNLLKGKLKAVAIVGVGVVGVPIAVGFGISDAGQAAAVARVADGVVVGSALIDTIERDGPAAAPAFIRELRAALDAGA
jgi:Kef-type K+ transport system membrane component KefB